MDCVLQGKATDDLTEIATEAFIRNTLSPGDWCIDLGAHAGRHSMPMSDSVGASGAVIAYECQPGMIPVILKSIVGVQRYGNIHLREKLVSDKVYDLIFFEYPDSPGLSSVRPSEDNSLVPEKRAMASTTLDQDLRWITRCELIKADIEGSELKAFRGGINLLTTFRPFLVFEHGREQYNHRFGEDKKTFFDFFNSAGYKLYSILGFPFQLQDWEDPIHPWQFVAVPNEKPYPRKSFQGVYRTLAERIKTIDLTSDLLPNSEVEPFPH
jgi:FkbM family methyltransferase